jgi:hypothetical protein
MKFAAQIRTQYSQRARGSYKNPVWTTRVGIVDCTELDAEVQADIAIASGVR